MGYVANTPEALIKRSDSLDPNTTCRGITGSGRPCRRQLAQPRAPKTAPRFKPNKSRTVDLSDPNLYCHQHRDQANAVASAAQGANVDGRASIDTLTGRLGILSMQQQQQGGHQSSGRVKEFSFCCFRIPLYFDDPTTPPPRPSAAAATGSGRPPSTSQTPSHISNASQTLIPPDAPPATATRLMHEMSKPVSKRDEAGYIYIFWLTPESESASPSAANARSILEPTAVSIDRSLDGPGSRPGIQERRPSDVLASFAAAASSIGTRSRGLDQPTLLLKIGRANNVMRRMNEWKRQCGYDLSLIRFYPYIQSGSGVEPRKMPHSHKVEHLIHLELSGLGLRVGDRSECAACGRTHKEWFEVAATREGVMRVDEAIKRWVDWDERLA